MDYLALTLPGGKQVAPPADVPSGGLDTLSKVFGNALTTMIILAVVLSLIFLVLGGMQWISSGGDKNKVAAARAKITWAIVGLIITLAAFFIINIFGYFFNVKLL